MTATVFEGFETLTPNTITATVPDGIVLAGGDPTTASPILSTSHVTDGTYSFHVSQTGGSGGLFSFIQPSIPSGATKIAVDVYLPSTVSTFGAILCDDDFTPLASTLSSGAHTLSIAVQSAGDTVLFGSFITSGNFDGYFDNLRFTDNGGTNKGLINSFEVATDPYEVLIPGWTLDHVGSYSLDTSGADTGWETEGSQSLKIDMPNTDIGYIAYSKAYDLTGILTLTLDYKDFSSTNTSNGIGVYLTVGTSAIDTTYGVAQLSPGDPTDGQMSIDLSMNGDMSDAVITMVFLDNTTVKVDNLVLADSPGGEADGASAGSTTVVAVGASTAASPGTSSGSTTVSGVGSTAVAATGSAAGTSTVSGESGEIGSSTGSGTVAGTGSSTATGDGSSAGTTTPVATGSSTAEAVGSSAGVALVEGVSDAATLGVGAATGSTTVSGVGTGLNAIVGSASGSTTVSGGGSVLSGTTGSSSGSATVSGVITEIAAGAGSSSGSADGDADATEEFRGEGRSGGTTTVDGVGTGIQYTVGTSHGHGKAYARSSGGDVGSTGEQAPIEHIQDSKKLQADAYIELFQIILSDGSGTVFLTLNNDKDWQGANYEGTLVKLTGVGQYADSQNARPSFQVRNPLGVYSSLVDGGAIDNATVVRIRVLKEHFEEDIPVYRREQWRVARVVNLTNEFLNVELRDMLDGQAFVTPGRMFIPPDFPVVSLQ